MKRTITLLLIATVVVSTFGTQAFANSGGPSPLEEARDHPHPSVSAPTSPSDSHGSQAQDRAEKLTRQMRAQKVRNQSRFRGRFVGKANRFRQAAQEAEPGWEKTIAHRSVGINTRVAIAYQEGKQQQLTEREIRREANRLRNELESSKKRTTYRANSPTQAVVLVGEIERSLTSAEGWIDQVSEILNRDDLSKSQRLAYAAGALEGARGNLNDARLLHQQYRSELQDGKNQETTLEDRYAAVHGSVKNQIESASYSENVHASDMNQKADGYLDQAETRYGNGYKAAALLDLLRAQQFVKAAEVTADVTASEHVKSSGNNVGHASKQDVYDAKKAAVENLNTTLDGTDNGIVLLLLRNAERQIVGGDEDLRWVLEHPDAQAQQKAYARYIVAHSLADTATDTAESLEESNSS